MSTRVAARVAAGTGRGGRGVERGREDAGQPKFGQVLRDQAGQAQPVHRVDRPAGESEIAGKSGVPGKKNGDAVQEGIQGQVSDAAQENVSGKLPASLAGHAADAATGTDLAAPGKSAAQAIEAELLSGPAALNSGSEDSGSVEKVVALREGAMQGASLSQTGKQVGAGADLASEVGLQAKVGKDGPEGIKGKEDKQDAGEKKNKAAIAGLGAEKLAVLPPIVLNMQAASPAVPLSVPSAAGQKTPETVAVAANPGKGSSGSRGTQANPLGANSGAQELALPGVSVLAGSQGTQPEPQAGVGPGPGSGPGASEGNASPHAGDSGSVPDNSGRPEKNDAARQQISFQTALAAVQHLDSGAPAATHQIVASGAVDAAAHTTLPQQPLLAGASGPGAAAVGAGASPYDRMDQGAGSQPVVLHSGAHQMAVGLQDPKLGWVEIQTQSAAGRVDATLVASSGQTHDSLAAQLPALSQFLEQRDVRVGTLAVHHPGAGTGTGTSGGSGFGPGGGYGNGHGRGAGSGHGGGGGRYGGASQGVPRTVAAAGASLAGSSAGEDVIRPLSYISVRA